MSYLFLNTPLYIRKPKGLIPLYGGVFGACIRIQWPDHCRSPAYVQTEIFAQRPPRPGAKAGTGWGWLFRYGKGLERGLMARLDGLVMNGHGWLEWSGSEGRIGSRHGRYTPTKQSTAHTPTKRPGARSRPSVAQPTSPRIGCGVAHQHTPNYSPSLARRCDCADDYVGML